MNSWVKVGVWVIVAVVAFWLMLQIVGIIFAFVSWLVSIIITLAIVGILLYVAYVLVSKLMNDSTSGETATERERLFE